jgi:hypothetical protein
VTHAPPCRPVAGLVSTAAQSIQGPAAGQGLRPSTARPSWARPGLLALLTSGCATLGTLGARPERPPLPLASAEVSSDARIDSSGVIAGSFVGEGTSRSVHLLSSDASFIAGLVRRWRPERERRVEPLAWLARRGTFAINLDRVSDSALFSEVMLAGSPDGHTRVKLQTILLYGAKCRQGAPQAELVVEPARSGGVSLRGPVVGSFRGPEVQWPVRDTYRRDPLPEPGPELVDSLVERTSLVMDSLLASRLPAREVPLTGGLRRLAINSLADEDAADVIPIRLDDGRIRYAVSLRESRRTARGAEALAAIVMIWDASLSWRQVVFLPTLLGYGRGGLAGPVAERTAPFYWRRLQAVSGFAFKRDYVWMEQVNVKDGSVRWVILEPRGNIVVAAADVDDGC